MRTVNRYDAIGHDYAGRRRSDSRIARRISAVVGRATRVLNVGAGTGSYEDELAARLIVAVEPSAVMINQRASKAAPVVQAAAEDLPFTSNTFDVALALLTVHHWDNLHRGLTEMRRVARRQVVLTIDPTIHDQMWLLEEYVPAIVRLSDGAPLDDVVEALNAHTVEVVPIPADCRDGFLMAYWRRPEMYLDRAARANTSAFALISEEDSRPGLARLAADLSDGTWQKRHADLIERTEYDAGLRLVIAG